jgi:hypothetical protein
VRIIVEGQITSMGGIEWKQLKLLTRFFQKEKKLKLRNLEMK